MRAKVGAPCRFSFDRKRGKRSVARHALRHLAQHQCPPVECAQTTDDDKHRQYLAGTITENPGKQIRKGSVGGSQLRLRNQQHRHRGHTDIYQPP